MVRRFFYARALSRLLAVAEYFPIIVQQPGGQLIMIFLFNIFFADAQLLHF
jgi:hypothetical protein